MPGRGQDGVACDFRSGAGGGWNRQHRGRRPRQSFAAADDFEVIQHVTVVGEHGGDGFARIQGAAAAKADYQIASLPPGQGNSPPDHFQIRLALDCKGNGPHLNLAQGVQQPFGPFRVATCRDQSAASEFCGQRTGLTDCARAKNDAVGGGKFKTHERFPPLTSFRPADGGW